jgi:hypothetical protein
MSAKSFFGWVWKLGLLIFLYFLFWIGGSMFLIDLPTTPSEPGLVGELPGLLILSITNVLVLVSLIFTSRWRGWKLALVLGLAHYGVTTFITQVETWYFLNELTVPPSILPDLFLMGLPVSFIFIPLAVLVCGKWKAKSKVERNPYPAMTTKQLILKLAVVSVIYVIIYWCAGYFIAWQNPELREFYGSPGEIVPFWEHTLDTFQNSPDLLILQLVRGLLFAFFVLPLIRGSVVNPWLTALLIGLLLAVPHLGHIIANPLLPLASVRLSHMLETATSTFLFGLIIVWLLHRQHKKIRDLV